jgi:hypothetical protein
MAKLTDAQRRFLKQIEKSNGNVYFRRKLNTEKEQCFIGSKRVNPRVFFFFYSMGYLEVLYHTVKRVYEYYDLRIVKYKLDEYLEDYQTPYVIPE